jgi:hypothetical protein
MKKLINEKLGISTEVLPLSNSIKNFIFNSNDVDYFRITNINTDLPINSITVEKFNFDGIKGNVRFKEVIDDYGNDKFDILLTIYYDFQKQDENEISSFLNHEFHHFFDYQKRFDKNSKTKGFVKLRNKLTFTTKNPIILKFINIFYLSLDEEINARVQQFIVDIKNGDISQTTSYKDSKKLIEYDINELDILSDDEKVMLLNNINNFAKEEGVDLNFNNFNQFKNSFSKRFKTKGKKLLRKIIKLTPLKESSEISRIYSIIGEEMINIFDTNDFLHSI